MQVKKFGRDVEVHSLHSPIKSVMTFETRLMGPSMRHYK
jgi:hypothetical protein